MLNMSFIIAIACLARGPKAIPPLVNSTSIVLIIKLSLPNVYLLFGVRIEGH